MSVPGPKSRHGQGALTALLTLLIGGIAVSLAYDFGWAWGIAQSVRNILGLITYGVVMGGAGLVFAIALWRGTPVLRAVMLGAVIPLLWLGKEVVWVLRIHGVDGLLFPFQTFFFVTYGGIISGIAAAAGLIAWTGARLTGRAGPGAPWLLLPVLLSAGLLAWAYMLIQALLAGR